VGGITTEPDPRFAIHLANRGLDLVKWKAPWPGTAKEPHPPMLQRIICIALFALAFSCTRKAKSPVSPPTTTSPPAKQAAQRAHTAPGKTPTELLATATSAFNAGLVVDQEEVYLLTEKMAYLFLRGGVSRQVPIENGFGAGVTKTDFVYWKDEAIWKIAKTGGTPRRIVALANKPTFFMTSGEEIAWLSMPVWDQFELQVLQGNKVRTLLYSKQRIETAVLDARTIYFVRKDSDAEWSLGALPLQGGDPHYAAPRPKPVPAKLAAAGDVFYYDMTTNEVRRLPPDLSKEEVIRKGLICSPLAVSTKLYCPNMGGLFALDPVPGSVEKEVFPDPRPIANVAASPKLIAWLGDAGPDRLSLMMLPTAALASP
jgi:hypothetical protein